jgi:hypothetical protein
MKAAERTRALRVALAASSIASAVLLLGAGQTLARPAPGLAASGSGLYVRLFETTTACGSRLAGLDGPAIVSYADSSLCTEQGFGRLTGQAGVAGSLIWIAGERTLERMRDIGGSAFKRTLPEDRRVIAVSPNAANTEVFTVEQRTPTDGYSPVVRGVLNVDLTD